MKLLGSVPFSPPLMEGCSMGNDVQSVLLKPRPLSSLLEPDTCWMTLLQKVATRVHGF